MPKEQSIFEERLAQIQGLEEGPDRDEAIRLLTQDYPGQEAIIAEELSFADTLMDAPKTQGIQAGEVYVAGSGAGHLADALRTGLGAYGRKTAMDKSEVLSGEKSKGMADMWSGLAGSPISAALRANPSGESADIDSMQGEIPMQAATPPPSNVAQQPSPAQAVPEQMQMAPGNVYPMSTRGTLSVGDEQQPPMMPSHGGPQTLGDPTSTLGHPRRDVGEGVLRPQVSNGINQSLSKEEEEFLAMLQGRMG